MLMHVSDSSQKNETAQEAQRKLAETLPMFHVIRESLTGSHTVANESPDKWRKSRVP